MSSVEERLAFLEGQVQEHTRGMEEFRSAVLRLDLRLDGLDSKVDRIRRELAGRIDALDATVDRARDDLVGHIDRLDQKVSRGFFWAAGIQWAVLLALIGTLLQVAR